MSLVRWLRKNNTKIMAIVVAVLMIGFIGGSYLQQFARRSGRPSEAVAYFGKEQKITQYDFARAQQELEILKLVRADAVLRTQDLRALLLGELLFPEHSISMALITQIRQLIENGELAINEKQINDIYRGNAPTAVYWLLLTKEAQQAGFKITDEEAGQVLALTVPKLFNGSSYRQLVNMLMQQQQISQEDILTAFSKLISVIQYVKIACSDESLTTKQIAHQVSRSNEKMNISFVRLNSEWFTKDVAEPSQQQIDEQFGKYKTFLAGDINNSNPYGFGYKQPDRIQLEYLAVKLDDVAKLITQPTSQEMEDYYQRNVETFEMSYRADPNDPNSPVLKKTRTYGEVAGSIARVLSRERTDAKAENILHQAKESIEAKLQTAGVETEKLTSEQLKQLSGDYETAAKEIGEKNSIKIYAGKTGLLSAADMQSDRDLKNSYVSSFKANAIPLTKVVFAVEELHSSELGPFDPPKPKLYENIGPIQNFAGRVTMLVRITEAQKASVPKNIDQSFSIETPRFNSDANQPEQKLYSVRKNVVEDLKKFAAMEIVKVKSQELIALAKQEGWDSAIAKFNKLYPQQDTDEPNAFKLQHLTDLTRLSKATLEIAALQSDGNPIGYEILSQTKQKYLLLEQLYSLIPPGSDAIAEPTTLEFKLNASYYGIKDLTVSRINQSEYEKLKARTVYEEDFTRAQSMAIIYLNPGNIVKRMNFKWAKEDVQIVHPEESMPLPEVEF